MHGNMTSACSHAGEEAGAIASEGSRRTMQNRHRLVLLFLVVVMSIASTSKGATLEIAQPEIQQRMVEKDLPPGYRGLPKKYRPLYTVAVVTTVFAGSLVVTGTVGMVLSLVWAATPSSGDSMIPSSLPALAGLTVYAFSSPFVIAAIIMGAVVESKRQKPDSLGGHAHRGTVRVRALSPGFLSVGF